MSQDHKSKLSDLRVHGSLILMSAAALLVPTLPNLQVYQLEIFTILVMLIGLWALVSRAWFDVVLAAIVAIAVGGSRLWLPDAEDIYRFLAFTGLLAFLFLHVILLIGPWSRFVPKLVWIYKHRRHLGVATFYLGLTHGTLIFATYFSYDLNATFSIALTIFGFTALFIMAIIALTSWDFLQKKVKPVEWVWVHAILLVIYVGFLSIFFTQIGSALDPWLRTFLIGVLVYWVAVSPLTLPKRFLKHVDGWKQLHVLIYAAYFSTLIHVWMARVFNEVLYKQIGFFALAALVVGSHIVGLVMAARQRRREKTTGFAGIVEGGKTYIKLDAVKNFEEGAGRKFVIEDYELAVFKHDDRVFAIDNRCPHQGGPLSDGIIINGYVECPWHQFQFSIEDGKGPPEHGDEVTYHPTIVRNGVVFVNIPTEPVEKKCSGGCGC